MMDRSIRTDISQYQNLLCINQKRVEKQLCYLVKDMDQLQFELLRVSGNQGYKMTHHIITRGHAFYINDAWTMCLDERNESPFPQWAIDYTFKGIHNKTNKKDILNYIIPKLDRLDLISLALII